MVLSRQKVLRRIRTLKPALLIKLFNTNTFLVYNSAPKASPRAKNN